MALSPLLEVLNKAAGYLKEKGVPQPRLDAELLLARVLGVKRLDLYLQFDRPLAEAELESFRGHLRRRGRREPLQHILGDVPFRELTLKVDARALIPRPETEILVDLALKALPAEGGDVLEVGVGAGPVFLSLRKECLSCRVFGVDISEACLELTRENAERNGLSAENLFHGDAFAPFPGKLWDVVVSNPPYVGEGELAGLQPEVRNHDPRLALVGGREGWEFAAGLAEAAFGRVKEGGILVMEIGAGQFEVLREKASAQPWSECRSARDYEGVERFMVLGR